MLLLFNWQLNLFAPLLENQSEQLIFSLSSLRCVFFPFPFWTQGENQAKEMALFLLGNACLFLLGLKLHSIWEPYCVRSKETGPKQQLEERPAGRLKHKFKRPDVRYIRFLPGTLA